jgi:hypothetical protein
VEPDPASGSVKASRSVKASVKLSVKALGSRLALVWG